jgi:hypothetical protein
MRTKKEKPIFNILRVGERIKLSDGKTYVCISVGTTTRKLIAGN